MSFNIKTAVHSGIVTPVVSCPTERVIVLSLLAIASRTLISEDSLSITSSTSDCPSPAAITILYSLKNWMLSK